MSSRRAVTTESTSGCSAKACSANDSDPSCAARIVSDSTALTCCTSPSGCPVRGTAESGCGPDESTMQGTSTTASAGSPGRAVPLRTLSSMDARSLRAIAAISASATPS